MANKYYDPDSEVAFLALLINNPSLIHEVSGVIQPHVFTSEPHQVIFTAMQRISDSGSVPEITLLLEYLSSKKKLADAGGKEYLDYLLSSDFVEGNFKAYEDMLARSHKARGLIKLTADAPGLLNSPNVDVDVVIEQLIKSLDSLATQNVNSQVVTIGDTVKGVWDGITERINNPGVSGVPAGIPDLDLITGGLQPGDFFIIGGRPSMGKTAVSVNMALSQAKLGIPTLSFNFEMSRNQLVERMLAIETGIPLIDIRLGNLTQVDIDVIKTALVRFKDKDMYPIYMDTTVNTDMGYIKSTIRKYHKQYGIKVVYLDYVQLMAERSSDATHAIGRISRDLKLLARELEMPIVLLSQLNRGVEAREDKRPVMADLRQSGSLEEDPDLAAFVYRDEHYNRNTDYKGVMEVIISKNRQGPTGTIFVNFEKETNSITKRG